MPDAVAELHRAGLAAVLAADADFQIGARLAAQLRGHLDQLADAFLIEHGERIVLEDLGFS
jgi:glyoxylate carboligase